MLRVLIVEDEPSQRLGMARLITELSGDTRVFQAPDGLSALDIALRERLDLILTDIRMPVMDGFTFLEKLAARGICCHTVIISAYEEFEYARKALRLSVADYLTKPFTRRNLASVLENARKQRPRGTDLPAAPAPGAAFDPMEECLNFVHAHYEKNLTLEEMAERFHFHPSYLSLRFKQHTGLPFSKYVTKLKINRACELLTGGGEQIQQVASSLGYREASYFNKVFKSVTGISPNRYRRMHSLRRFPEEAP